MSDVSKHERELREMWQRLHEKQHQEEDKARDVARMEIDRRLEAMNELRSQISSERGRFVARDFYDEQHNSLRVDMDNRLKILETTKSNMEGRLWMMGAAISGIVIVINLVLHYLK